jgi:hypothetical protein
MTDYALTVTVESGFADTVAAARAALRMSRRS